MVRAHRIQCALLLWSCAASPSLAPLPPSLPPLSPCDSQPSHAAIASVTPASSSQPRCPRPSPHYSRVVCKGHNLLLLLRQLAAVAVGGQGEHGRLPGPPLSACGQVVRWAGIGGLNGGEHSAISVFSATGRVPMQSQLLASVLPHLPAPCGTAWPPAAACAPEKSCGRVYQKVALSVPPLPPQHQYL